MQIPSRSSKTILQKGGPIAIFVIVVIVLLFVLLIRTRTHPAFLFAGALFVFFLTGTISAGDILAQFVNPALVTLVLVLQAAAVIEKTPLTSWLGHAVLHGNSLRRSLARMCLVIFPLSAFLNNTAVVASFLGPLRNNRHFPPSKLLIPLSYAAILGGTATLIGTSTNLIVNGLALEAGMKEMHLFQFAWVGVPACLGGFLCIVLFCPWLLPAYAAADRIRQANYFLEARVLRGSAHIGRTVAQNRFRSLESLFLAEIIRDGRLVTPVSPDEVIQADDILVFVGDVHKVKDIERFDRLAIFTEENIGLLRRNLREVVLAHTSSLLGKKVQTSDFRAKFDAAVVAVRRGSHTLSGKIGSIRLEAGDTLLLAVGPDFGKRENLRSNFFLVTRVRLRQPLSGASGILALALFAAAVLCGALGLLPLLNSLVILLFLYVALGFFRLEDLRGNANLDIIVLVGSALGISKVMLDSGASELIAKNLLFLLQGSGAFAHLAGIYLLTVLLVQMVTNNAAAALAFPLAYSTALSLQVSPLPFVMAVAYGASASFLTPYAYQTNLIVYGPGSYQFLDYTKNGLPLLAVYSLVVLSFLPVFFPF
ncbi:MAG: SLC13 family permease [Candidatus Aminicenantes bacterium]|nr:SLC13 family permease [Candidatus Aminicenantes bacterium]